MGASEAFRINYISSTLYETYPPTHATPIENVGPMRTLEGGLVPHPFCFLTAAQLHNLAMQLQLMQQTELTLMKQEPNLGKT